MQKWCQSGRVEAKLSPDVFLLTNRAGSWVSPHHRCNPGFIIDLTDYGNSDETLTGEQPKVDKCDEIVQSMGTLTAIFVKQYEPSYYYRASTNGMNMLATSTLATLSVFRVQTTGLETVQQLDQEIRKKSGPRQHVSKYSLTGDAL